MAKGRKNGCPVSVADWLIYIMDKSQLEETWVRIYGLTSMTRTVSGETEDSSADTDIWSEPYITKRSGTIELEGVKKVIEATGEVDRGQELLDDYAEQAGCGADATIKIIDPYGHGIIMDTIVTSAEESADSAEQTRSWSLEQVGEAEVIPYVQMTGVHLLRDGEPAETVEMKAGGSQELISIRFEPENASNRRFRVNNSKRAAVRISDITENGFVLTPVGMGSAEVTVTTVNNGCRAQLSVRVMQAGA
ncbi:MAG: hypothetical protein IJ242_07360 [Clostridia bacterium]|nr:hypothetical protein [Clostridia bacterium]